MPMTRLETFAMELGVHEDYSKPRIDRLFLMAALLAISGLLPALWVVTRAATRLERRDDSATPSA
jgi:hypothetical protein